MATASGESLGLPLEELSNQFLICPLCLEQYTQPKVLPCQHTFCLECLRGYVNTRGLAPTVPCPLCKEIVYIPENDVSKFKSNFMIVSLLQFVENAAKTDLPSTSNFKLEDVTGSLQDDCGACGEKLAMSTFCQACQLWLCKICTKAHSRLSATANHQLLSSKEVDAHCKAMVGDGEVALCEMQINNTEQYEAVVLQQTQLPENVRVVKDRITSAAAQATKIIEDKLAELNQQADQFLHEQADKLAQKGASILKTRGELDNVEDLLKRVKLTEDGLSNQKAIKKVEEYLNRNRNAGLCIEPGVTLSLAFSGFGNSLSELKQMELGEIRVVSSKPKNVFLTDRSLNMDKIASLVDGDYISALAINKFADKFVVANNRHIMVFKPDSKIPKPFLSPISNAKGGNISKPWGLAYLEEHQTIYISHAGQHEGDGGVSAYTLDGNFQSHVMSGLTLPRGIAIHKSYLFVCDQIDRCVYILTTSGRVIRVLKKTPDGKFLFTSPMFVSVGKNGTIAVSDNCTAIKLFDKDCQLKYTYVSEFPDSQFWDVHVMQNGTVLVCDWKHGLHKISSEFDHNGLITTERNILREPSALAALESGNIFYIGTCSGDIYSAI